MERIREDRAASTLLAVLGERGAVTLEAWWSADRPSGVIGLHHAAPMHEGQEGTECDLLPQGFCYPDSSYRAGAQAAPLVLSGDEEAAWVVAEDWYRSHIEGISE
jgi:hypothetical protein